MTEEKPEKLPISPAAIASFLVGLEKEGIIKINREALNSK
jgi:hypothetical protein